MILWKAFLFGNLYTACINTWLPLIVVAGFRSLTFRDIPSRLIHSAVGQWLILGYCIFHNLAQSFIGNLESISGPSLPC